MATIQRFTKLVKENGTEKNQEFENLRSITFLRLAGTQAVTVDNFPLQGGIAQIFKGEEGDRDIHEYEIEFGTDPLLDNQLWVFKEYEIG